MSHFPPEAVPPVPAPKIFIEPQNGFETYISAAFFKKEVPATIVNDKQSATLILTSGAFAIQEEKSGLGKLARCAYAFCMGIDGSQTISVNLKDAATAQILWGYSVRKMGAANYQSSAEGASVLFFGFHSIFAILEPSGEGLPLPGTLSFAI